MAPVILARLASISLDVAAGGDVVQDLAQVIFVISCGPRTFHLSQLVPYALKPQTPL